MQRLRQAADIVQRRLRDFADFPQILAQRRALRHLLFHAPEQRADGRQHLPKLVMQFARYVPQSGFLRRYQFLRQIAALLGKRRQLGKNQPIRTNQVQTRQRDGN